jgi:hypothetical protein
VVVITCRPFALEEIEQSSQELLVNTSGGYCRSFFQESLFSLADGFGEQPNEANATTRATAAK